MQKMTEIRTWNKTLSRTDKKRVKSRPKETPIPRLKPTLHLVKSF